MSLVPTIARPHTALIDASDLIPLTHRCARVYFERFQGLEVTPLNPEKDISRMSNKRLKFRYGESDGTDKLAEDELRRRGLTDRQIRGVIYGYRQGEYTPKGGPYVHPGRKPTDKQVSPNGPSDLEPAANKVRFIHSGRFKGSPLTEVPEWYLEWEYGSFTKDRKYIEKELRSRGYEDGDLERCRKQHPVLGKSPKKQGPKD